MMAVTGLRRATALVDLLVVMNGGRIEHQGPHEQVYLHPRTRFAATSGRQQPDRRQLRRHGRPHPLRQPAHDLLVELPPTAAPRVGERLSVGATPSVTLRDE